MTLSRWGDYLAQLRQAAQDALDFTQGMSEADFLSDRRTQNAVVMSLIVIGEAASKVAERHPEMIEKYPEIPWRNMRGMRNRIAHGYFDIDFAVVWRTVAVAIPNLLNALDRVSDGDDPSEV